MTIQARKDIIAALEQHKAGLKSRELEYGSGMLSWFGSSKTTKIAAIDALLDLAEDKPGALSTWQKNATKYLAVLEAGTLGNRLSAVYGGDNNFYGNNGYAKASLQAFVNDLVIPSVKEHEDLYASAMQKIQKR